MRGAIRDARWGMDGGTARDHPPGDRTRAELLGSATVGLARVPLPRQSQVPREKKASPGNTMNTPARGRAGLWPRKAETVVIPLHVRHL